MLGWADFRELDLANGTRSLKEGLDALAEAEILEPTSTDALAYALGGAFNELALWVAHSRRSKKALGEAIETLDGLVASVRA